MINIFKDFYLNIKINNRKQEHLNLYLNNLYKRKKSLILIKKNNLYKRKK